MNMSVTLGKLQGIIVSFRTGPSTQHPKELIIQFPGIKTASEAARLIGRKIACPVQKRTFRGKIIAPHGKNGQVRALFRKGLPGQVGTRVEIIG